MKNLINRNSTLRDALNQLNTLGDGMLTLLVTDNDGVMLGTLTDGDIRRAFLAGATPDTQVSEASNTSFTSINAADEDVTDIVAECRRRGIKLLPRLDSEHRLTHVYDLTRLDCIVPLRALMMAGGRGERLRPLTDTTPKPLLPVGGKPIIDRNIELMRRAAIDDITVAVGYKADMLRDHLGDSVKYITESEPLGTIGALSLMPDDNRDVLVMNADLLTGVSIEQMYLTHKRTGAEVTMGVIPYTVSVPYAIVETNGNGRVIGLREKPAYTWQANAGIYIFARSVLMSLKPGEHIDAPELIEQVIERGGHVSTCLIDGGWLDIGTPEDYARANR